MAEEQVQELKEKLQAQQAEFQNYKAECKELEEFLESESTKKQQQIKKLKEDAIKKEKNYTQMKNEFNQLKTENQKLKTEVASTKERDGLKQQMEEVKNENNGLKKKIGELEQKIKEKQEEVGKIKQYQDEIKIKQGEITGLKVQLDEKQEKLSENAILISSLKTESKVKKQAKQPEKVEKVVEKNVQKNKDSKKLEKKILDLQEQLKKSEETISKQVKVIKQLKNKNVNLLHEKQYLTKENKSGKKKTEENIHIEEDEQMNQIEEEQHIQNQTTISALLLTKKHYISPFLQVQNENTVKVYRSTKTGFQKSLGSLKYKLNSIKHDPDTIIQEHVEKIQQNLEKGINKNSVIIFGVKKSTKKYLMANLLLKMKQFLNERINVCQENQLECLYIKASVEVEKQVEMKGKTKEEIEEIMEKVIELGQKKPKKIDPIGKKKGPSKPKIRYFKLTIGQQILQIITTSHTINSIKDNSTIVDALNQICYGKLPNALQCTESYRHILLTLNPIVSCYDDCKVTLSIGNCLTVSNSHQSSSLFESPVKESLLNEIIREKSLNDLTRKTIQSFEKETEQNTLKTKRLEDQIYFYRLKFDELELRLKTLLSTHNQQNSYLKKSPVALSYEKMLKFVHTVLARNTLPTKGRELHIQNLIEEGYNSTEEIL